MSPRTVEDQRKTIVAGIVASGAVTILLWVALLWLLPAMPAADPFAIAVQCAAVAALLTLLVGVNAIAHERLFTQAINPLAGVETQWMRVNARYLSNTVEQFLLFAAGLLALSAYASARVMIAATIVWTLHRWAFWIGYHRDPLLRGIGAIGVLQSMLILIYCAWRFTAGTFGVGAAIAVLGAFVVIEAILFRKAKQPGSS